jgi:hypothetical protein
MKMRPETRICARCLIRTLNDLSAEYFLISRAGTTSSGRQPIDRIRLTLACLLAFATIFAPSAAWCDGGGIQQDAGQGAGLINCDRQADRQSAEASNLTPIAPTSILNPILLLNDLNRRKQQEANQPRLLYKIELERQQCRKDVMAAAASRAQELIDQKSDTARGYRPITFEAFALDGKILADGRAKISIKGAYLPDGILEWLFATQVDAIQAKTTADGRNISRIPLLTENATRDFRQLLLRCRSTPGSDQMGCPTVITGHVSICSITGALGSNRNVPCIIVENGR